MQMPLCLIYFHGKITTIFYKTVIGVALYDLLQISSMSGSVGDSWICMSTSVVNLLQHYIK